MNNPDDISESLETMFWVKYFLMRIRDRKIRIRESGWKKFGYGIENGPGINIPDPLHWYNAKWFSAPLACHEMIPRFDRRIPFGNSSLSYGD
jgi:hypothetical protein